MKRALLQVLRKLNERATLKRSMAAPFFWMKSEEMPLDMQSYLLRILESGEFIRVGSSKILTTNVRVIAATNNDLMENIQRGKFREDLYYRLNTVPIRIPALKERIEDIPLLFRKFAIDFSEKYRTPNLQLDDQAIKMLQSYQWPEILGN